MVISWLLNNVHGHLKFQARYRPLLSWFTLIISDGTGSKGWASLSTNMFSIAVVNHAMIHNDHRFITILGKVHGKNHLHLKKLPPLTATIRI